MIHYKQNGKTNCGQVAVASLTGVSVERVEGLVGHSGGTKTQELIRTLWLLDWRTYHERAIPMNWLIGYPDNCLAQVRGSGFGKGKHGWHWIAISGGQVCDGGEDRIMSLTDYHAVLRAKGGKITSVVECSHGR